MLTVNGNYLQKDGKPFFWLGDTAWLLYDKLERSDVELYYKNRKLLGYNVLQVVLVYEIPQFETVSGMPHGTKDETKIEYFSFCRDMVRLAADYGFTIALLPAWGSFVKNGYLNDSNYERYARFLGDYFREEKNIIWVLGGDVRGDENINLFNSFGNILKSYNPERLVTFHPFGRTGSYLWFNDESWLDFNMFQSGHRRYDQLTLGAWDD